MATASSPTSMQWAQSPVAFFLAGMLVPTLTYLLFNQRAEINKTNKISNIGLGGDLEEDDSDDEDVPLINGANPSASWSIKDAPYKMVLCVNTSLGMGKGKIAAQCGHAAVGCYKRSLRQCPSALSAWEKTGCAKIAVKCPSEEEMGAILDLAAKKGIPIYFVEDAGRTQIAAGSRTVLGLGPAPVREFDGVTSHLKLM
eukprot:CAMPEP_0172552250 /NCGR_PEP_ID=MMETSP1067-20121228/43711_1 /TAXON_ID=265564 ORGANISM="Thalassiosira punctigera, Strain Tpunct2005C2" /NCGR_SAMPLE_ID=MMETSP1067 /ASSEMBLY_ACC=CAM_ASM_000444 /LENGTH=198 /DNA_ID=CAMNT_0013340183 /DNA_START=57 /DNA_END=653 /DNA_ORIENTATION=+